MAFKTTLYHWLKANRVILTNAGSIIGTTAVTSGLGFLYWWLAARQFSAATVGFASAAISAMSLLATVGMLGLGTLLIGEIPRQRGKAGSLIATALAAAGLCGFGLGVAFALVAPALSAELQPLANGPSNVLLFALGVSVTALTLVLDQALIGLLRGDLQLWRNGLFAATKLGALWLVALLLSEGMGLNIYATWLIGNQVSLLVLLAIAWRRGAFNSASKPQWRLLHGLGRAALSHHLLNLALLAPSLILPVMVTIMLSASTNAYFYIAWMVANLVFVIPASLTTVLYAVGAADPAALASKVRLTVRLSLVIGIGANLALLVMGGFILNFFGRSYAEEAEWSLHILGLGVFAITIKDHYVAIYRIHKRVAFATVPVVIGSIFELVLAGIGAQMAGLPGLAIGWLAAMFIEAVLMTPAVYRAAVPARVRQSSAGVEAVAVESQAN